MSFLPTQRSFRFLFSAAVVLMMIGGSAICYEKSQWRSIEIMNPEWSTTVPVTAKRGQTNIHAISVRCRGKLDGSASIRIGESSAELVFGGDKFDVEIRKRDWYDSHCDLHYFATNVHAGRVVIYYRFHD